MIDEEESSHKNVSLNCVVTGAPSLRISWFIGTRNLTFANPSRYSINESMESDKCVSTLTIRHPTYNDSGQYTCVSTILNDITGEKDFRAQENTTLTVLGEKCMLRCTGSNIVYCCQEPVEVWRSIGKTTGSLLHTNYTYKFELIITNYTYTSFTCCTFVRVYACLSSFLNLQPPNETCIIITLY